MILLLVLLKFVLAERVIAEVELIPEVIKEIISSPDISKELKNLKELLILLLLCIKRSLVRLCIIYDE